MEEKKYTLVELRGLSKHILARIGTVPMEQDSEGAGSRVAEYGIRFQSIY